MAGEEAQFRGRAKAYWLDMVTSANDEARWEAVDAIRHLCDPEESVDILLTVLKDDSYWKARALAAHALCDLAWEADWRARVRELKPQLVALLADPSAEVREQIAETISVIDDPNPP